MIIQDYKEQLRADAALAARDKSSPQWMDMMEWPRYLESEVQQRLYDGFSDEELLDILRETAARLERLPNKNDVFCIYRVFLKRRFGTWPGAQAAAGLRPSREERRENSRRRHERNERHKAAYRR